MKTQPSNFLDVPVHLNSLFLFLLFVFFYLVLLVDILSSDPLEQRAGQDTQSEFCGSGCLSGSSEGPVHGTYQSTKSQIK